MFILMFLFLTNVLISFGICSTQKLSKKVALLLFTCKSTQWVPISEYSSRFIIYILWKLSWEKTQLNLGSFWKYFCIAKFIKGWGGIKSPFYYYHNQLLQFLHLLHWFFYLLLPYIFLFQLKDFLINLHVMCLITY